MEAQLGGGQGLAVSTGAPRAGRGWPAWTAVKGGPSSSARTSYGQVHVEHARGGVECAVEDGRGSPG
ncbi:hypothetical protein ACLESD_24930, partial [Pyxidicoccus sp. 3LFB2]